jgi:ABC-type transport system substrate-binding protein
VGRDTLLFVRNPHYALGGARGGADTIQVFTNRQPRQAMLGIENARVDLLMPPPLEYGDRLARAPDLTVVRAPGDPPVTWWLALNAELAPLARRDARRAVAWGMNRERLAEQLGPGFSPERRFSAHAPGEGGAIATAPGFDPAQAALSLAAAEAVLGIRVPVTVPRASPFAAGLDALTPGLARAGIQVDAVVVTGSEWERRTLARRGVQATLLPIRPVGGDPLDALAALFVNRGLGSGWGGNFAWYHPDAEVDSLLLSGLKASDPAARAAFLAQVETVLGSDLPLVPLRRPGGPARRVDRAGREARTRVRPTGGPQGPAGLPR